MLAVLLIVGALALAGAAIELALPRIAAGRIRAQLIDGGGEARGRGCGVPRRAAAAGPRGLGSSSTASGLVIGLAAARGAPAGLSALDGFEYVDVELQDFPRGRSRSPRFVLARDGDESYALAMRGSITGAELVRLGEGLLRRPPGRRGDRRGRGGLPIVSREVSISVQIELISEPGGLRVGTGGGTVAGYPAGPIATLIAAAVARRLELAP